MIRGAVPAAATEALRIASARVLLELLDADPHRVGNRGPRRYSLGSASSSHHWIHDKAWLAIADLPRVLDLLDRIYSVRDAADVAEGYMLVGGGGDVVLAATEGAQCPHKISIPEPTGLTTTAARPPPHLR